MELAVAYAERSPSVADRVAALSPQEQGGVVSELKTMSSFLTLRFADAGLQVTPEETREAVLHRVAGLLSPDQEMAVLTALEDSEKADKAALAHMLGAYTAALATQLLPASEVAPTLRALGDLST